MKKTRGQKSRDTVPLINYDQLTPSTAALPDGGGGGRELGEREGHEWNVAYKLTDSAIIRLLCKHKMS
jgi:hypothetical protein